MSGHSQEYRRPIGSCTEGTGIFELFGADKQELADKALDGYGGNESFWVFLTVENDLHNEVKSCDIKSGEE